MTRQNIVSAKIPDDLQDWLDQQNESTSALVNEALRDLKVKREGKVCH